MCIRSQEMYRIFSKNLRMQLAKMQKSQTQLANEMGICKATINQWCCGKTFPRLEYFQKLAAMLDCQISDLFLA